MEIKFITGKTITATPGRRLLDILRDNEIYLVASCGGKGTCGKCRVRVIEGDAGAASFGKLTNEERAQGMTLACMSMPRGDMLIEIPEGARLVVGDKIAISRAVDLKATFDAAGATISPLIETIELEMSPPTINDNISDLDRMRRALAEKGIEDIRFSHGFVASMADALRDKSWKLRLGYHMQGCAPEAVFLSSHDDIGRYGIAVDIGTTTVVVYLVDLRDGRVMDTGSTYNSQIRFGDDVITRIIHATEEGAGSRGLEELRDSVAADINNILNTIAARTRVNLQDIESAVVAGNTTMSHLFWGLNPGYIREAPYIPTLNSFPYWMAGTARLNINPQAPVYTVPCVASYVGGDIVAGVLASRMHTKDEIALFMDIGTNGEIAIGGSEWLVTAACSAGPCFEGSGIRHGMRATEGAIESIRINPDTLEPEYKVVGGARPIGICGSGMIDAISEMFLTGVIDQRGKFVPDKAGSRVRQCEEGLEYVFFEEGGRAVSLTEVDIENILRAKAAIYAGVSLLLAEMGLTVNDVQRIYIAGGFGNYLNVERAILLGMLPDLPLELFSFLGNTSVAGAYLSLMSSEMRDEADAIASRMTYYELSVSAGFMDEYMSAMFLPHTDISRFPTVAKRMGG